MNVSYEEFVAASGPRLRAGLVAAYGPETGIEAASEALAWGWEHWDRLEAMENPAGYLYRVGQTAARRSRRPQGFLPMTSIASMPDIEDSLTSGSIVVITEDRVRIRVLPISA